MYLKRISIVNYKNISQADLEFSPKINYLIGNNGEGKTNILDAVYYLSFCKSHQNFTDSQNVNHEQNFFVLQGIYEKNEQEETVYCGFKRRSKKKFKCNDKEYERLSEHIGLLPLVLISPNDETLIYGGSSERRKFVDGVISQYDSQYLEYLIKYNRNLQQRNSLLKTERIDKYLIEVLDEILVDTAAYIHDKRQDFLEKFIPIFEEYYHFVSNSNSKEIVKINYLSHLLEGDLALQLKESFERDKILGHTTKGIHKDELEFTLNEYAVKRIASQGQNKTFLIALKLAQFDFLKEISSLFPILLFDDIFDKLDAKRVRQIINLVAKDSFGQIFITDTNRKYLDEILQEVKGEYKTFIIKNGEPIVEQGENI